MQWIPNVTAAARSTACSNCLDVAGVQLGVDDQFVVFYHMTYADADEIEAFARKYPKAFHIGVSGSGNGNQSKEANAYLVRCVVDKPDDASFVTRITRFLAKLEVLGNPDFDLLEPSGDEALGLRLLCEAYAMPEIGAGKKSYQPARSGASPIAVNCPEPGTWFDLLGAAKPTGDENQKEAAITAFGKLMGDASGEAMDLARSIIKLDSDDSEPADKFVQKIAKITANHTGGAK